MNHDPPILDEGERIAYGVGALGFSVSNVRITPRSIACCITTMQPNRASQQFLNPDARLGFMNRTLELIGD